jgi:DNA-binding NtrC family response regulator
MPSRDTVLIVEDMIEVRETLSEGLSYYSYRVIPAATVHEAEEALQHLGVAGIDLVIADINLTRDPLAQEGYSLYQRWSALYPALRFILISGDPHNQELPAIRAGVVRFLAKPFGINTLLGAVRELLGK